MRATIIYPPLVEQSYKYLNSIGIEANKDEIYREMVKNKLIDQLGEPTSQAIKQGLVSVFNLEHETLREFKNEFTLFKNYPVKEFYHGDNIWYISNGIAEDISAKLDRNKLTTDEIGQFKAYYNFRNYDSPQTAAEFKGTNHPYYSKYDDKHFHLINGEIHMDSEVIRDIANRVFSGEIDGNCEKAKAMLSRLDEL